MKPLPLAFIAFLSLAAPLAHADTPGAPMLTITPPAAPSPAAPAPSPAPAPAAAPTDVPGAAFAPARYEVLWTKSPFAVATSETVGEESPDYILVGIANFDGISYASVLEAKPPQEHFLISTDHPNRGMTLKSINRSHDGTDTYVVVDKGGQSLTLKLQIPPAGAAGPPGAQAMNGPAPGNFTPQIPMPGATGMPNEPSVRPLPRFHRPPIHLPPPQPQPQPPPTPAH